RIAAFERDRDAVAAIPDTTYFTFEADEVPAVPLHHLATRRADVRIPLERLLGPRHVLAPLPGRGERCIRAALRADARREHESKPCSNDRDSTAHSFAPSGFMG